jgi:hypothetical protein
VKTFDWRDERRPDAQKPTTITTSHAPTIGQRSRIATIVHRASTSAC